MNKYEKLIEHIINDEEGKARALFHEIVVEKSRDIYESLMDEEYTEEGIGGDQVGGLVDEITMDETDGIGEGDEMDMDDMDSMSDEGDEEEEEPEEETKGLKFVSPDFNVKFFRTMLPHIAPKATKLGFILNHVKPNEKVIIYCQGAHSLFAVGGTLRCLGYSCALQRKPKNIERDTYEWLLSETEPKRLHNF